MRLRELHVSEAFGRKFNQDFEFQKAAVLANGFRNVFIHCGTVGITAILYRASTGPVQGQNRVFPVY